MALSNTQALALLVTSLVIWVFRGIISTFWNAYRSPLHDLPGPKSPSLIYGWFREIFKEENSKPQEEWVAQYGNTISYAGFLNVPRLFTLDPRALNYILTNTDNFQKPEQTRRIISRILGDGILNTEGAKHKQQRRIMNPSFGPGQVRELMDIFWLKAGQLRDNWLEETSKSEKYRTDVLGWLSRATLDVIGLAGFDYDFNSLRTDGTTNELADAFAVMFQATTSFSILPFLAMFFPPLRWLPNERARRTDNAMRTMDRIGQQILRERKAALLEEKQANEKSGVADQSGKKNRDLLSVLLRANMSENESQRMSDKDVLAQVPTFLVAGHETTSTTTTWCLYSLTQHPNVQIKLREEIMSVPDDTPSMETLQGLPYLDAVVRETMRHHSVVGSTVRHATYDDTIPLSEPITDRHGRTINEIRVAKGDPILIPILSINRAESIWGPTARSFDPSRWLNPPEAANSIPGVWGKSLAFLGGPRACIGYRFAILEMKVLLFTLVRNFEYELAVPKEEIIKRTTLVQRPLVQSEFEKGSQLPLFVKPVQV